MKNILFLILLLAASELASAACVSPISRTNFVPNTVLTSTKLNLDLNNLYTQINELPGDCVTDETISTTQIKDFTIQNSDISASADIDRSKLSNITYGVSTLLTYTATGTSYVDVPSSSVTFNSTGNPVVISLVQGSGSAVSSVSVSMNTGAQAIGYIQLMRGATVVGEYQISKYGASSTPFLLSVAPTSVSFIDTTTAGEHVYKLRMRVDGAGQSFALTNCKLFIREL